MIRDLQYLDTGFFRLRWSEYYLGYSKKKKKIEVFKIPLKPDGMSCLPLPTLKMFPH